MRIVAVDRSALDPIPPPDVAYTTSMGEMFQTFAEVGLGHVAIPRKPKAQLILTSPPFPLNHKKRYGNKVGEEYVEWLASFAPIMRNVLRPNGSIVIELGNAWEAGRPLMSTLALRALLAFLDRADLQLCQQFVVHNPARLPSPAQWVTAISL